MQKGITSTHAEVKRFDSLSVQLGETERGCREAGRSGLQWCGEDKANSRDPFQGAVGWFGRTQIPSQASRRSVSQST